MLDKLGISQVQTKYQARNVTDLTLTIISSGATPSSDLFPASPWNGQSYVIVTQTKNISKFVGCLCGKRFRSSLCSDTLDGTQAYLICTLGIVFILSSYIQKYIKFLVLSLITDLIKRELIWEEKTNCNSLLAYQYTLLTWHHTWRFLILSPHLIDFGCSTLSVWVTLYVTYCSFHV